MRYHSRRRSNVSCPRPTLALLRANLACSTISNDDEHTIAFVEEAYSLAIHSGHEFSTDLLRFTYSSMTTPQEVWEYNLRSRCHYGLLGISTSTGPPMVTP
jgi:hypothetical protein